MIEYTVIEEHPSYEGYMYHVDRQRAYETACDGCGEDYETKWPHGQMLRVITDRSGSEQASTHNNKYCMMKAVNDLVYVWED